MASGKVGAASVRTATRRTGESAAKCGSVARMSEEAAKKMGDVVVGCDVNAMCKGGAWSYGACALVTEDHHLACGACGSAPQAMLRYVNGVPKCERCGLTYSEPVSARVMRLEREVSALRAFMVAGTNVNEVFAAAALGVQPATAQATQEETKAERLKVNEDKAQRDGAEAKCVAWVDFAFKRGPTRLAIVEEDTCEVVALSTWSATNMQQAAKAIARVLERHDIDSVYGDFHWTDAAREALSPHGVVYHEVIFSMSGPALHKGVAIHKAVAAAMNMCDTADRRAAAAKAEGADLAKIGAALEQAHVLSKLTQMTAEHRESRCYTSGYAAHDIGHAPDVMYALQSLAHAGVVLPPDPPRYGWRLATEDKAPAAPLAEGAPVYLADNGSDATTTPGGAPVGYVVANGGMTVYPRGEPPASTPQAFVKVRESVPAEDDVIGEPKRWTDAEVVAIAAAFAASADESNADAVNRIGYAFGWERARLDALRKLLDVPCEPQAPLPIAPDVAIASRVWAWLTRCDRDDGYYASAIADAIGVPLTDVDKSLRHLCEMGRAVNLNPNAENFTEDDASRYRALAPAAGHVIGVEMGDAPVMPAPPQQDATAALALALLATGRATAPQSVAATMAAEDAAKHPGEAPAPQDDTSQIKPPSLLTEDARRCLAGVAVYADSFNWCNEERLADGLAMKHSIVGQHLWLLLRASLVERGLIGDDGGMKHVCWRLTAAGRATLGTLDAS